METKTNIRQIFIITVCYLYIVLFVYAAFSKILDFENFRIQLGQSPLLSAFAGFVSIAVLIVEIGIAILLSISRFRSLGLLAAFGLMAMFTTYIYIILNYSSFIPCSCGGILEKMGWTEHLVFNIIFMALAAVAGMLRGSWLPGNHAARMAAKKAAVFPVVGILGSLLVVALYLRSDYIIHEENNFTRRFPPHPVTKLSEADLRYNTYYFAGSDDSAIYLGNYTTPLNVSAFDKNLKLKGRNRISLDNTAFPFRAVKINIRQPYFFLFDGTVPVVFRGKTTDWKATLLPQPRTQFNLFVPIDSATVAFRGDDALGKNILGIFAFNGMVKRHYAKGLLQQQVDGVFDTDGMLHYDPQLQQLLYLYYYRNQFTATDRNLRLLYRGNTIDTTAIARIKIATHPQTGERKLVGPPPMVNACSAMSAGLLYVNSALRGKSESQKMWKQASVIDVYDLVGRRYLGSFYIHHEGNDKLSAMLVHESNLYVLIGTRILRYKIDIMRLKK